MTQRDFSSAADRSSEVPQKLFRINARIAERAVEGEAVDLVVESRDDPSPILVLCFDVGCPCDETLAKSSAEYREGPDAGICSQERVLRL